MRVTRSDDPQTLIIMMIIFLFTFLHFFSSIQTSPLAPALYVFSDSLFDSGHNNLLPTIARADYLPYGINFVQGVTGIYTNGRTVADFMGTSLYIDIYIYTFSCIPLIYISN